MRTPDPIDILSRTIAVPMVVWSATTAALGSVRRRAVDPERGRPNIVERMSDEFFERVEERFRARWSEDDSPPDAA
jgi:uncharacterized protein YcbX